MTAPQNGKALELHSESSVGPLGPQMQRSRFPSAGSRFHGCDVDLQARTDLGFALPEHGVAFQARWSCIKDAAFSDIASTISTTAAVFRA